MVNKVLFVDDEELMLDALRRQAGRKFNVVTARGGQEALGVLASTPDIAVVVADMRMPVMSGLEFLQIVRDRYPTVIRMMLTGNVDRETAEDAVETAKVFNYLTKPCETANILDALQMCMDLFEVQTNLNQLSRA